MKSLIQRSQSYEKGNDQDFANNIFSQLPAVEKAKIGTLPIEKYANGKALDEGYMKYAPLTVHANWRTGSVDKIALLKDHGFWFMDEVNSTQY